MRWSEGKLTSLQLLDLVDAGPSVLVLDSDTSNHPLVVVVDVESTH